MPTCDDITTQALHGAMQGSCIPTKPLLAMEPKIGFEPTTYALRVRCSTTELPGRVAHSTDLMVEKLLQLQGCSERAERRALE